MSSEKIIAVLISANNDVVTLFANKFTNANCEKNHASMN